MFLLKDYRLVQLENKLRSIARLALSPHDFPVIAFKLVE